MHCQHNIKINRKVFAIHTKRQSPTFLGSVNILAQAKGSIWRLLSVTQFANILCTAVPSFYGIQYLKRKEKKSGSTTKRRRKLHYGGERLRLCLPSGPHYWRRWQNIYARRISAKLWKKLQIHIKNPSITNHRFLLSVLYMGVITVFFGPKEPSSGTT